MSKHGYTITVTPGLVADGTYAIDAWAFAHGHIERVGAWAPQPDGWEDAIPVWDTEAEARAALEAVTALHSDHAPNVYCGGGIDPAYPYGAGARFPRVELSVATPAEIRERPLVVDGNVVERSSGVV